MPEPIDPWKNFLKETHLLSQVLFPRNTIKQTMFSGLVQRYALKENLLPENLPSLLEDKHFTKKAQERVEKKYHEEKDIFLVRQLQFLNAKVDIIGGYLKKIVDLLNPAKDLVRGTFLMVVGVALGYFLPLWFGPKEKQNLPPPSIGEKYNRTVPSHIQNYIKEHTPEQETTNRLLNETPTGAAAFAKTCRANPSLYSKATDFRAASKDFVLPPAQGGFTVYRPRSRLPFRAERLRCH